MAECFVDVRFEALLVCLMASAGQNGTCPPARGTAGFGGRTPMSLPLCAQRKINHTSTSC